MGIDSHRHADTLTYALSMIAIPIVTLALLLVLFQLRHIELERWPGGHSRAGSLVARDIANRR